MTAVLAERPTTTRLVGSKRLAVLRIVAGLLAVYQGWTWRTISLPPPELRFFPQLADLHLPATQELIYLAAATTIGAGLLVAVGYHHRMFGWVAATGITYLGWLATYTGKVNHNHHILWFLIVATVAPAASEWAVRKEPVRGSVRWTVTGFCVVLGLIYFGAGLAKLVDNGFAWGGNLVALIDITNGQKGLAGAPDWLRNTPVLAAVMGTGAHLFELLFLPLIVWPATRKWVWPAGLVFHAATWWLMNIPFWTLMVFYLVFVPWGDGSDRPPTKTQSRVTVTLCAMVAVFAFTGVEAAWPFASYPSFRGDPTGGEQVHVFTGDGTEIYEVPGANWDHAVHAILNGKADEYASWVGVDRVDLVVTKPDGSITYLPVTPR